ncbi:phosphate ABC transporter permease [Flavobacterium sp. RS13.1]|uniref:phosphate ABC transporter permease n=1 Tax=Flavobacterium sp. RS13.1 TaxID=3400345 RepID=UPI003AAEC5DF
MKNILVLFFLLIGLYNSATAQGKTQLDIWAGKYFVLIKDNDSLKIIDTLTIEKIADVNPKDLTDKYKSDLARWTITSNRDKNKDKNVVRRFLFDPNDNRDEYKEFGWTDLHRSGKMNCIDCGHFFICQTLANSDVKFGQNENYLTNTGIFGIWLHYGVVELQKIKNEK